MTPASMGDRLGSLALDHADYAELAVVVRVGARHDAAARMASLTCLAWNLAIAALLGKAETRGRAIAHREIYAAARRNASRIPASTLAAVEATCHDRPHHEYDPYCSICDAREAAPLAKPAATYAPLEVVEVYCAEERSFGQARMNPPPPARLVWRAARYIAPSPEGTRHAVQLLRFGSWDTMVRLFATEHVRRRDPSLPAVVARPR